MQMRIAQDRARRVRTVTATLIKLSKSAEVGLHTSTHLHAVVHLKLSLSGCCHALPSIVRKNMVKRECLSLVILSFVLYCTNRVLNKCRSTGRHADAAAAQE